ncbi:MAG TPA: hypothetical protein PLQ97_13160 [Myxococcota bacterium]|nr:hypothetical protein [Myxococcota bacterium]HQK52139.1 hypothetical protein [Myxococcota bacterium]
MRVGILTNLNSRKNRGQRARWLDEVASDEVLVRETRDVREIRPVVEEFIASGCRYWVANGGDGTFHWLMNVGHEVLAERGAWRPGQEFPYRLVPTNGGTIDFVARKAGISRHSDAVIRGIVQQVRSGREMAYREIDTLVVTGHRAGDPEGVDAFRRVGFAVAIGGIGQRFFARYYQSPDPNPWTIIEVSLKAAAGQVASLPGLSAVPWLGGLRAFADDVLGGTRARVTVDGRRFPYGLYQGLHVSSVDIDFGTMRLFPYAAEPGRMHVVVGAMDRLECAWKWTYLVAGRPVPGETWHEFAGRRMEVEAAEGGTLDPIIDGEMYFGLTRLTVEAGPVLRVPRLS